MTLAAQKPSLLRRLADRITGPTAPAGPPDPPVASIVSVPTVSWPDPKKSIRVGMTCPNCRGRTRKSVKLTVNFATPDHPMRHSRLLSCPDCTCLFYEDQNPPDYTEEAMLGRGRMAFYMQQGAGVSLITRPLAMVRRAAGSRYLEVGCGFGFGLDFAIRAKGWIGAGIDPAGLSAVGRELLDVPIELRYLGDDEPDFTGQCDVVMASETIEHVTSPIAFLHTLKRALKPGGILVLTTPNADELDPSRSQGLLVPLLSPGLHLVFQNAGSLRRLLEQAGFTHIVQQTDSVSLVAFASDAPFELETDAATLREVYRRHLEDRARTTPSGSDLFYAFAGRALFESSNDGDWERAGRAYDLLRAPVREKFGLDLDTLAALPEEAGRCRLERLLALIPLNLGAILYGDAMRRMGQGSAPRAALGPRFLAAAAAADALRRALGELAMDDGMSEAIAWAARAEAVLCDAARAAPDVVERLAALPPAPPGGEAGEARRAEIAERALAWMVNSGHVAMGAAVAERIGMQAADWANPRPDDTASPALPASRRDALFCLGVIDAQLDGSGDAARGVRRFAALRRMAALPQAAMPAAFVAQVLRGELQARTIVDDLAGQALAIEQTLAARPDVPEAMALRAQAREQQRRLLVAHVNAGQFEAARLYADIVRTEDFVRDTAAPLDAGRRDALFALGMFDLQPGGDPAWAARLLARVRTSLAPVPGGPVPDLLWAALRAEVQAVQASRSAAAARDVLVGALAALGRPDVDIPSDLVAFRDGR